MGATDARPTLFMTVGLPGAGKTTRAIELETRHNAVRLSLDSWMLPLFLGVNDATTRDLLEGLIISLALQTLRFGASVVLDFGLWTRNERSALRHLATTAGANSQVVFLDVDRETQLERVTHRYKTTPEHTFAMTQEELDHWRTLFQVPDGRELIGTALDDPPEGFVTWEAWASSRWPSFRNDSGRQVRLCIDHWQAQLGVSRSDAVFHERLKSRLDQCSRDLLRHGVDVTLEDE